MDMGFVEGSAESRSMRRFVTRRGEEERGRESDLVHSGHQLGHQLVDTMQLGCSRHPLPCGSDQLYN